MGNNSICSFEIDFKTNTITFSPELLNYIKLESFVFSINEFLDYIFIEDRDYFLEFYNIIKENKFSIEHPASIRIKLDDDLIYFSFLPVGVKSNNEGTFFSSAFGYILDVNERYKYLYICKAISEGASPYNGYYSFYEDKMYFNKNFEKILCIDSDGQSNLKNCYKPIIFEDGVDFSDKILEIKNMDKDDVTFDFKVKVSDKETRWYRFNGKLYRNHNNKPTYMPGIIKDITIQLKNNKIKDLLFNIPTGITYVYDFEKDILEFSRNAIECFGLSLGVSIDDWRQCIHPNDRERSASSISKFKSGEYNERTIEYRIFNKISSKYEWFAIRSKPLLDKDGKVIMLIGNIFAIETMKGYKDYLEKQSRTNFITGLPSRAQFFNDISNLIENKNSSGYLILLDIDDFKSVNTMFSRKTGDKLLYNFSKKIKTMIDESISLFHFGGDLFLLVLANRDINEATEIAKDIANTEFYGLVNTATNFFLTVSVAITPYNNSLSADDVFFNIDVCSTKMKKSGSSAFVTFYDTERKTYLEHLKLEKEIIKSVENNFENFEVFYQPLFSGDGEKCLGAEALMRYKNEGRIIPPYVFIPILESNKIMIEAEEWLMKTVASTLPNWIKIKNDSNFIVNINATAEHLHKKGFKDFLINLIDENNLQPNNLVLEITEGSLIIDRRYGSTLLQDLKDFGIRIAIDDFGTGFSSLNYLKTLPINELKIDRSFIQNLDGDFSSLLFVNSIVQLAISLNYIVCIEGIETMSQKEMIKNLGVEFMQGYYFDKPLEALDFENKYIKTKGGIF